ncbi:Cof-type HAD-IIB family hydrolase [Liquorilactobacillus cacaonum]|uniref:Cof-type HAD-IIB family hydrolase n=1 Tax=Liquorilactobacillus cacaonum TaxID=483012 RepID=UPI0007105A9D|nr:Cof-type HAD-IIB family hydrolase [Liquorilactobacillus cacaonum]
MEQKLIALDLDGTTLNADSLISKKTKDVLQRASQEGHIVSIVTGRPFRISKNYYDELNLKTPMINFNGALGHIPYRHWQNEYQDTFSREIAFDLLKNKDTLGIKLIAAEAKSMMLADSVNSLIDGFFPTALAKSQVLNEHNLVDDPASITLLVEEKSKEKIITALKENYGDYIEIGVWGGKNPILELAPKGITKEKGVRLLANDFKIDRKNIIAFGDEHNDYEMIDYAGWGVVMKNGTETLKKISNDITNLDNTKDGLAIYLEKYLGLAQ